MFQQWTGSNSGFISDASDAVVNQRARARGPLRARSEPR